MLVFTYINNIESCIDMKLLFGLCKACMFLESIELCFCVEMTLLSKSFDMATGKALACDEVAQVPVLSI